MAVDIFMVLLLQLKTQQEMLIADRMNLSAEPNENGLRQERLGRTGKNQVGQIISLWTPVFWHVWSSLTLQKEIHSYRTRNSYLYRLPLYRTNIKQFSVVTKELNFTTPCVPKSSTRPPLSPLRKYLRRFSVITISSFHTNVFKY